MASVLEPRAGHRDVIGGEFALCLHEDREAVVAIERNRFKRLEELQAIGRGDDCARDVVALSRLHI